MNSNLMISGFPHNIRLAVLNFFCCVLTLLCLCPVGCLSLEKLNWDSQQSRDLATSLCNKKKSIVPILFLYYEESLVSSNLNSNLLRFHCAHPTVLTYLIYINTYLCFKMHTHTIVAFRKCSDWRNGTIGANHTSFW